MTTTTTLTEHSVPWIEFQRATVAFDTFCSEAHDYFASLKDACLRFDLTPDVEQLKAMLLDRAIQYVKPSWEQEAVEAVGALLTAIACPEDGWTDD